MQQRQRLRSVAIGIMVTCLTPVLAQTGEESVKMTAPGPVFRQPGDLYAVWDIVTRLRAGTDLRKVLQDAEALAHRIHDPIAPDVFEAILQDSESARYERNIKAKTDLLTDVDEGINGAKGLVYEFLRLIPPVSAFDEQNDNGRALIVMWQPLEGATGYLVERREPAADGRRSGDQAYITRNTASATEFSFRDDNKVLRGHKYQYRVTALGPGEAKTVLGESGVVEPELNYFNQRKGWFLVFVLILCSAVVFYIGLAQRGVNLKIRKIAGLEAIDEAVGRAVEMGRPILFVPGIQDMDNIQTVAGLIVLGSVARTAAQYDALLEVPTSKSLVMTAARETVHAGYMTAGRPDAFNSKKIYYVTDEQFGFVVALTGMMVREKPAACIYMGAFFAESLILAETANTVGSIQIAGTAEPAQLPFFVAACDYVLIGEEFFAASAYLSGEPRQLGSLKGQDVGKMIVMFLVAVGALLATIIALFSMEYSVLGDAMSFITEKLLNVAG